MEVSEPFWLAGDSLTSMVIQHKQIQMKKDDLFNHSVVLFSCFQVYISVLSKTGDLAKAYRNTLPEHLF